MQPLPVEVADSQSPESLAQSAKQSSRVVSTALVPVPAPLPDVRELLDMLGDRKREAAAAAKAKKSEATSAAKGKAKGKTNVKAKGNAKAAPALANVAGDEQPAVGSADHQQTGQQLVHGCGKCRRRPTGCSQCKNPAFNGRRGP